MEYLDFLDLGVLTCLWVSARPQTKESTAFVSPKQFQWLSTERLLISSNWRWYLSQRIVYCLHITLFSYKGIAAP